MLPAPHTEHMATDPPQATGGAPSSAVRYQYMPPLSPEEYAELEASIREHGVMVPILLDPVDGAVIDGHHRKRIAESLGIECPAEYADEKTDAAKTALAYSLNLHRRNLTVEVRRELVARLWSDGNKQQQIADTLGVTQGTVAKDLAASRDNIPRNNTQSTRLDALGRQRPTQYRPRVTPTTPAPEPAGYAPTTTAIADRWVDPEVAAAERALRAEMEREAADREQSMLEQLARQEALNVWSRTVDGLTAALALAKDFAPPPELPDNYVSVTEFKRRLVSLVEIVDQWETE